MKEAVVKVVPQFRKPKDRMTVVDSVYHQHFNQDAVAAESRFSRELQTEEQPYERQTSVGEEWQPLDIGWFDTPDKPVGHLIILNTEGKFSTNPTPSQRQEVADRILEVTYDVASPPWIIYPGESFRGTPSEVSQLKIRCRKGTAEYTLWLFPA